LFLQARHQQLVYESKVYSLLSAGVGIPRVQYSGVENNYNCIVMDLLGHSLEDLFNICQRRFSLKVLFFEKTINCWVFGAINCLNVNF